VDGHNLIDLSQNTSVLGPSRGAIDAASREVLSAHAYPERQSGALLAALAKLHGVGTNQIIVGNGAQHVLRVVAQTFLQPGDISVGLAPTYPGYKNAAGVMRAEFRGVAAAGGGYDAAAWVQAVRDARLAWLCTPNNPTGRALAHDDAARIVAALPPRGIAVFDETYRDFVDEPDCADGLAFLHEGRPVIVVHTFSKLYGLAGLRVGYALARTQDVEAMMDRLDAFPVNRAGQAAAVAALADEAHQAQSRRLVLDGRRQLQDGLGRLGIEYIPSQANFVTARFGNASERVFRGLKDAGYLVRSMDGPWGLPGWLRITIGFEAHNTAILQAIQTSLQSARA
jgi:histidinol-phosphate aminotransferase